MNETELLFTKVLNCDRNSLYLRKGRALDKEKQVIISSALKRRISGEPIQYILGESEFMGLNFMVNSDVLIPRPETERLVETAVSIANNEAQENKRVSILDLGTGSGCIAISLAKLLSGVQITGVDISGEALAAARKNAQLNNVSEKINFLKSDLFEALLPGMRYDICVSNPPYICSSQIDILMPEIQFEPRVALDGGEDGLDFYREIINKAHLYLKRKGYLILEMGFNQYADIRKILQNSLNFEIIEVLKDYNSIDRVIVARNG
ncbi:MAG: peptide chain release factor N(5)-glutamine methyltransferase [Candidatus Omnitrophota bacterium]|jgi:release factor glutamine methyltransferase